MRPATVRSRSSSARHDSRKRKVDSLGAFLYNTVRFCPGMNAAGAGVCNASFPDVQRWMQGARGTYGEVNDWSET